MRKILLLFFSVTLLLSFFSNVYAHSVQVAYCTSCDGNVRVWVEHWHGNEDPGGTTMTLQVDINGAISNHVGSPDTSVLGMGINDLPCASNITSFAACPNRANTENDWVAYDFPNLPLNTPITITVVQGHTVFTEDGCDMFPASTGVIIIPPPPNYDDRTECISPSGTVGPIAGSANTTWTNDNPGIGLPASGTGEIPEFTPPNTGATQQANFSITNPCGTSHFQLTVLPRPNADFNADGNTNNPVCLGENTIFTDNSNPVQNSNLSSWSWDFGDNSPPGSGQNPSHLYGQPGQYTVELTITDNNSCIDIQTQTVTISPLPNVDFNLDSVCMGTTTQYTDLSTIDNTHGDSNTSWDWNFGDGQSSSTQNPTHDYANENQYDVQLIVTSNNGCVDSITKTAVVFPNPVADFSVTDECFQIANIFTDQSTVSTAHSNNTIVGWTWDFDDGNGSTNQNPSHSYGAFGTYNPTLTIVTDNNCSASVSKPVEVFELPVSDFSFINACDNESVILENSSITNASGNLIFDWDVDNDNVTDYTADSVGHVFAQDGFHDVRLIVENSNGCRDTITQEVTVYALPTADYIVDAVCEDSLNTFTNNSTINPVDNDVINQFNWSFGDGNTSTQENPTHNYGAENVYQAQLEVITNYGCKDSITKPVNVYPLPIPDFIAESECLGDSIFFMDHSVVSDTFTNNNIIGWSWDFDDGNNSAAQNPANEYGSSGVYNPTLTVLTDNGCSASLSLSVEVFELPIADFDFTNACDNQDVELVSTTIPNATGPMVYDWDIDSDNISDYAVDSLGHVFNQDGFHDVRLIVENSNGCRDTIIQEVTVYALPTADYIVDAVCEDSLNTFTNNSAINPVDSDVINQFNWSFGDGNTSTQENTTHTYGAENVYQAQLLVITNYGCKDSITKPVKVYPLPEVDFEPTDVCLEFDTQFSDLSTISNAYTTNNNVGWTWDFGDGNSSSVQNPSHAYLADGTYSATLTVVTDHGCKNANTKVVTVHPKPVVGFTGVDLEGCSPVCPKITSESKINDPSNIESYLWELSDGTYYEGAIPNLEDCFYNESGTDKSYDLTLTITSNEGCVEEYTESDFITVYHLPIADFDYSPEEVNVIDPVVDFNNTSLYADSYLWNFGNYAQSTDIHPTIEFPAEPESYITQLIAFTDKGCTDTISRKLDVLDKLVFYIPNSFTPDKDKYNEIFKPVFTSGYDPNSYVLYIYNRWGELIFESHDTHSGWDGSYGTNKNKQVQEGTYIWKINFETSTSGKAKSYTGHINLLR